jgi:hypothetical protein
MFSGRPVYDPESAQLSDRFGKPLDAAQSFSPGDDREDMAHFLRAAGYLFVRGLFSAQEIAGFLEEAEQLRGEAVPGDKLSWWGKDARGEAILCRVTRAAAKPRLRSLPSDPRVVALKDLADEKLEHRRPASEEEGVSIIGSIRRCARAGDSPRHRDCGMGGRDHVSRYRSSPDACDGRERRGACRPARKASCARFIAATQEARRKSQRTRRRLANYGDTMHAAPPPTRDDSRSTA